RRRRVRRARSRTGLPRAARLRRHRRARPARIPSSETAAVNSRWHPGREDRSRITDIAAAMRRLGRARLDAENHPLLERRAKRGHPIAARFDVATDLRPARLLADEHHGAVAQLELTGEMGVVFAIETRAVFRIQRNLVDTRAQMQ